MNKTRTWKRLLSLLMAVLLLLSITPVSTYMDIHTSAATTDRIIYLNTGGSGLWEQASAWFSAWVWGGGTTDAWYRGTKVGTNLYAFTIPATATNVIFMRKGPSNTNLNWDGEWNRAETTIGTANNQFTITSWSGGSWGKLNRTVTFTLSGVTKSTGNASTLSGSQYTAKLTANTGYTLPSSITIKVGSTTLTSGTHYTYNSSTGSITVYGTSVTDNMTITATGVVDTPSSYTVTNSLTGLTSNGAASVDAGAEYTATLSANTGYTLPAAITVKAGSTTLTAGTHYRYDSTSGDISIYASAITGNITITASGVKNVYSVTYSLTNITSTGAATCEHGTAYTTTLTPASGYSLPASITVTAGGSALSTDHYTYNSSTGALTVKAAYVTGNLQITAAATEDIYTLVGDESFMGSNWNTTDPNNRMTKTGDNIYTFVFDELAAGTYEIKAVKNGAYEIGQWPTNGNYSFTVTEKSSVVVTLDLNNHTLSAKTTSLVKHYSVTFTGTNITSNGAATANDSSNYTATLSANSGYMLPTAVEVKIGSTVLTAGTDYTYDSATGTLTIYASVINADLTITAEGVEKPPVKLYLKPGPWANDSPRFAAYFYNNTTNTNTWITMYDTNGDGVYECIAPDGYPEVIFVRMNPATTENNWDNKWNQTGDLNIPTDDKNCYEITAYGADGQASVGQWITFTEDNGGSGGQVERIDEIKLNPDEVFYVDTDLVDFLNDSRVFNNQVKGYYTNNQGISNDSGYSAFSYLNYLIAEQVSHKHSTAPLYFGSLNYIGCRYGRLVGEETRHGLGRWSTHANVALAYTDGGVNANAVVQGLVGNQLVNGTLADPETGDPLIYFNKTAADEWTNNGHSVMAYYDGLLFPFIKKYDENTKVTKYSYNSASDYAVYYDYANTTLYASNTKVSDSGLDGNTSGEDYGFYPLNKPGDKDNTLNHGFGAKFNINFTVGENGKLSNGEDVTFHFTGDDDVWVFIDGVLVLDMGGAHSMATGSINFATLTATVDAACKMDESFYYTSGDSHIYSSYEGEGLPNYLYGDGQERGKADTASITTSFTDLNLAFDYGKTHTMTVFYMERAGVESNFSMEFTMVPVPSGLTVSKELNDKEINSGLLGAISNISDYDFAFVATSPSEASVAFQSFTLTNKNTGEVILVTPNGNSNGTAYSTAIQGITNYTYAHSFFTSSGDHAFIPGTKFSITEQTKGIFSYSSTSWTVYDAKNGFAPTEFKGTNKAATFTMGTPDENHSYSYAVVFNNTIELGALQISKIFEDTALADSEFLIQVYLDLDGSGSAFSEATYKNLVYTIDGTEYKTDENGCITIKGGQTALISGIPAGADYRLVEIIPDNAPWELDDYSGTSGTIKTGETQSATFVNVIKKHGLQGKMIFVEAGTATNYALTFNGQPVTVTGLANIATGLTAVNNGTSISITGAQPNMVYTMECSGRLPNGEVVFGIINVYTYSATEKTYVFDFGLSSNLADLSSGDGLFQGGTFYNHSYGGTTATLISLIGNNNTQTAISAAMNGTIGTDGSYSAIRFTPVGFMSQVETYTYTVRISVNGMPFDANNPETGTILTGSIKVMPANTVYYEDNFNATGSYDPNNKIIYSDNAPGLNPNMSQSNDQSGNYGYDDAYLGGYAQSGGSSTTLTNGQYAYFTFSGTGFDLISRTNDSTAGFAVYVFTGGHSKEKLDFMNSFSGAFPADMVFVDTYYNNGDLHQVPVVNVQLPGYGQYTVYIQALATRIGDKYLPDLTDVTIDGIRIYNPLADTSAYPIQAEQNVTVNELRELYGTSNIVSLAGKGSNGLFVGLGKQSVVREALQNASIVENMEGKSITSAADVESIYLHGPNNELYLPKSFGISFSYTVTQADWTLQLGAKAVTASGTAKSITIYARRNGSGSYEAIQTIELSSTSDLYYGLTTMLDGYSTIGSSYDIIIINNSEFTSNEFVSLTTVKYAGITLI